jgi:hypothetical protein
VGGRADSLRLRKASKAEARRGGGKLISDQPVLSWRTHRRVGLRGMFVFPGFGFGPEMYVRAQKAWPLIGKHICRHVKNKYQREKKKKKKTSIRR